MPHSLEVGKCKKGEKFSGNSDANDEKWLSIQSRKKLWKVFLPHKSKEKHKNRSKSIPWKHFVWLSLLVTLLIEFRLPNFSTPRRWTSKRDWRVINRFLLWLFITFSWHWENSQMFISWRTWKQFCQQSNNRFGKFFVWRTRTNFSNTQKVLYSTISDVVWRSEKN